VTAGRARRRGRTTGNRNAELSVVTAAVEDDVQVGQEDRAGRRDLDVSITVAEVQAAIALDGQLCIHRPEKWRRGVAEVALPEVDRKRQPAEAIDRHRVTRAAEVDRGLAVPALVRRVRRHARR
jgi:hypothetical protein